MADLPMLEIQRVSKRFQLAGDTIEALSPVDLTIARGEFICLIGASGCGKSTLLRIIAGFETSSSGKVLVAGKPVTGPGPDRGMVFQDYALFPWMTVRQNIGFGPRQRGRSRSEVRDVAEHYVGDGRAHSLRRSLPAPAFRRHEAARRHRPLSCQRGRSAADG